jgi:hypothetical protein
LWYNWIDSTSGGGFSLGIINKLNNKNKNSADIISWFMIIIHHMGPRHLFSSGHGKRGDIDATYNEEDTMVKKMKD